MKTFYQCLKHHSKSITIALFFLILLSFSSLRTYATIHYVKQTATGLGNGISWANASNNLQAMIDASSANDEVWVMSGTYKPNSYPAGSGGISPRDFAFIMKDKVKVYGGFVGTETALTQRTRSIMVTSPSVLSGDVGVVGDNSDNAYHVVISVEDDNTTVLDGFTITKGNANNDDAFKAILVEFRPINPNSGGGLYNYNSSIEVRNCNFINNKSSLNGGGMLNLRSFTTIINCIFSGNEAKFGGGTTNTGGELSTTRPGSVSFSNCLFSNNSANQGGGIYNDNRDVNLTNCSFVNNNSTIDGGGIYVIFFSITTLNNCIVWANKKTDGTESNITRGKDEICGANYSDIEGGYSGTGNINQNPLFVNANDPYGTDNIFSTADDGLSIQNGSPCINAGGFRGALPTDITGFTRFANSDMGAYENRINMTSVTIGALPSRISCAGQDVVFAAVATVEGESRLYDFKVNGISKQRGASLLYTVNNLSNGDSVRVEKIFGDLVFVSNTIVITIKPLPIPNAGSNSPVLLGNTLNLNASGGGSYFWTGPNNYSSELQNPSILNATTQLSGIYIVKVTNNGCEALGSVQVAVNNFLTWQPWQDGRVITCGGKATFTIKVNGLEGGMGVEFSIDKINWFDATSNGDTYTFTVPQQGICRDFYARPKGSTDASKIIWGCNLDTYSAYPVACETCSSDLIWIQGGVITCNGKAKMTVKVLGLKVNTVAEFSIDQVNWFDATENGNTNTFTVPQQGICRGFYARPKGCNNPAKVIWGCYLDTYAGYPVICTDGQIPLAIQTQSSRTTNNLSTSEVEIMSVETMPNPVNDKLTIKIYLPKNSVIKATLISNIGREMEAKNFEGKSGENLLTIDMKSYTSGMYLLWVQSEELRIVKKVIKID